MDTIFKDIIDRTPSGVLILDDDFRIRYMNRFASDITGFMPSEAQNRFCYDILRAGACTGDCHIERLKNGHPPEDFIVDIITKDNTEKFIKNKIIRIQDFWVEVFHDVTREVELEKRLKEQYIFEDIITRDSELTAILQEFPKIAESSVPVLLEGESGVGKEVFATALQALSLRKDKAFVKINCASLPDTLLESELFGYKKGAFTDARKNKPGLFKMSHLGTLFLDEIGEMSLPLQAKLLRAVETGEIIPLGATGPEKVDVRILAATNKDLLSEMQKDNFREDLYYRLNVVCVKIPPLRRRTGDIPLFIEYFIHHNNIVQEKQVEGVAPEAMSILLDHLYPGNIRELRNIMEYAFIFCHDGQIHIKHLPAYLRVPPDSAIPPKNLESAKLHPAKPSPPDEKTQVLDALDRARWNKTKAAEILGIDRSTLWRKMKKFKLL